MLILGSYGFSHPLTRTKISGLLPDRTGRMLIIPLAGGSSAAESGSFEKECAVSQGFLPENITVFDENEPDAVREQKFRYIVVTGGNTFTLLHLVRKYGLDGFVRQQVSDGADYIGFSAGACLACPDVGYIRNFDDNIFITDGDFSALGLTDKYVLCHYNLRGFREIRMCREFIGPEPELVTINDDEFVLL